jgi:murein DD-endopeptidase MepM/ murein hydrolase activator NlpD
VKKLTLFAITAAFVAGSVGSSFAAGDGSPPSHFGERVLREGSSGADVKVLQRLLTGFGQRTAADGAFGPGTERSVTAYERSVNGLVDGIVSRGQARQMWLKASGEKPATSAPAGERQLKSATTYVFPVRGTHHYGDGFGAARSGHSHQGQDIMARTGVTVAAAQAGTVKRVATESAAGNYVVIYGADGTDNVYMHLNEPAHVSVGDRVSAGEPIGHVGCTGSCSGSHLHFEVWTAHWYAGGHAVDPLARLKQWDAAT